MKTDDLIDALGALDQETVLAARERPPIPLRRRIPRISLIAAVLALVLSLSAWAYYAVSHPKTAALMEEGPMTGGSVRPEIDETGQSIIDSAAIDLNLSQTSNGTGVTLDSLMGYNDPKQSLLYLTFTITPPEGFVFPEDMTDWCFWKNRFVSVPEDLNFPYAASTVKNPDGTASVLWMAMPFGGELEGHRLHLELDGFGTASKEGVASLFDGSRQIELPGHWAFDFELPVLPETQEIALDAAALEEAGLMVSALRLTDFGGVAELDARDDRGLWEFVQAYGAELQTHYFPEVDFEHLSEAEFAELCENGSIDGCMTEEQFSELQMLRLSLPPADGDRGRPKDVTLEYPDGTTYTVSFEALGDNLWINWDEQGVPYCQIVFSNPQPLSKATAVLINGVRIPLQAP